MKRIQDLLAEQIENGEFWDELRVENLWIHVVRGLIKEGAVHETEKIVR
jgi:hypothetical protein